MKSLRQRRGNSFTFFLVEFEVMQGMLAVVFQSHMLTSKTLERCGSWIYAASDHIEIEM
jgi:hypothetical protein